MNGISNGTEKRKIRDLARRYRQNGFAVRAAHGRFDRPDPIRGIAPDIVAVKGKNVIIIEVKSRAKMDADFASIRRLSEYAEKTPNVRFDLVVTKSSPGPNGVNNGSHRPASSRQASM